MTATVCSKSKTLRATTFLRRALRAVAMGTFALALTSATVIAKPLKIIAFGDSLTAGYLLPPDKSFPAQLERVLIERGHDVVIQNAGVSGDTAKSGLDRFDWAIPEDADAVILELGANDALRGLDPARAQASLDEIASRLKARNIPLLIAGMSAPRSLGEDYVAQFDAIFPKLAQKYDAILYPFFLEGVAFDPMLNLADGLHPNADGIAVIVTNIMGPVEELVKRAQSRRALAGG